MSRIIFFYINNRSELDKAVCCSKYSILITNILLNKLVLNDDNKYCNYCEKTF